MAVIYAPDPLNAGKFLEFVTDDIIVFDYYCLYCKSGVQNNEKCCTQCGAPRQEVKKLELYHTNPLPCYWGQEILESLPHVRCSDYMIEADKNFKRIALRCPECNTMLKPIEHGQCIRCKCDVEIASFGSALFLYSYELRSELRKKRRETNHSWWS